MTAMILGTLENINTNLDRLWRLQATCVIPSFEIKTLDANAHKEET
jgi:hypothetical protein